MYLRYFKHLIPHLYITFFKIQLLQVHVYIHSKIFTIKNQYIQVCLPGLYISLGLFHRLFTLLEEECQTLDRAMTVVTDVSMDGTSEPYQEYRSV